MKIRSVTSFFDPGIDRNISPLARFNDELKGSFEDAGFEVETTRLAATPFSTWLSGTTRERIHTLQILEKEIKSAGWDYLSAGPATPESVDDYDVIADLLASTQDVFFSSVISDRHAVYPELVAKCARTIQHTSRIAAEGFGNLRFACLGNVGPYAPFFPAAYHETRAPAAFSLAMECADEAVSAFSQAGSVEEARKALLRHLEEAAAVLLPLCQLTGQKHQVQFVGFDFSPAPFPEDWCSLGKSLETLGFGKLGSSGSLTAAALIADILDRGNWPKAGFNGLMLAVMEDSVLAARAAQGVLSINDLLLYSAVCGTGLDTIPLPGDVSEAELTAVLLDLGALATRLGKPLTARLMPIPDKKAGDPTNFQFGYFATSRIMRLDHQASTEKLKVDAFLPIQPRKSNLR